MKNPCKKCLVVAACSLICEKKIFYDDNRQRIENALSNLVWKLLPIVFPTLIIIIIILVFITIIVRGT
jgi:hypothetical protein